jgi:hypothetical protein
MRRRLYTRNVGVLLSEESYQLLINITDKLEVTVSEYIRDLVEKNLLKNMKKEKTQ